MNSLDGPTYARCGCSLHTGHICGKGKPMMSDEHKKAMSDQDIDTWLDQQANVREEPSSIERLLEEVGKADSKSIRSRSETQTTQAPVSSNEISLGSMPQFAEIVFRPNGEIWLNTDTIQLAIQPGISRILLGQPA